MMLSKKHSGTWKKNILQRGNITRNLGLDIGDRRIGVALGDPGGIIASPLTIINRTDEQQDIAAIIAIITQNDVGKIIAGLPVSMNGSIGHQAEKVKTFVKSLSARTQVPIEFRDESLTTVSARQLMQVTRKKKRREKTRDDAIAAAFILQGYLDEGQT
ncbi:Holliday junction resolvase RuvX [Chloroflexota bacterium]